LNLRGIILPTWDNYPLITWQFTLDDIRFWHLSDYQGVISQKQLKEAGKVDVLFISPNKVKKIKPTLETIARIKPKIVIWSHHIPTHPKSLTEETKIKDFYTRFFQQDNKTNPGSIGSGNTFTAFWQNILEMNDGFDNVIEVDVPIFNLTKKRLQGTLKPKIIFFRN
jgi:hypothetical protein